MLSTISKILQRVVQFPCRRSPQKRLKFKPSKSCVYVVKQAATESISTAFDVLPMQIVFHSTLRATCDTIDAPSLFERQKISTWHVSSNPSIRLFCPGFASMCCPLTHKTFPKIRPSFSTPFDWLPRHWIASLRPLSTFLR